MKYQVAYITEHENHWWRKKIVKKAIEKVW